MPHLSIIRHLTFTLGAIFLFYSPAFAVHEITFSWLPNNEIIEGYRIYFGTASRQYDQYVEVSAYTELDANGRVQATVTDLDDYTTYYFAATAYTIDLESGYSREIVWNPNVVDADGDGLVHIHEVELGTDPAIADTDGDGVADGYDGYPLDYVLSACADPIQHWDTNEFYDTVWRAYYSGFMQDGDTILITSSSHSEDIVFELDMTVTLAGGYDCAFNNNYANTQIDGSLTITEGTVIVENITIL